MADDKTKTDAAVSNEALTASDYLTMLIAAAQPGGEQTDAALGYLCEITGLSLEDARAAVLNEASVDALLADEEVLARIEADMQPPTPEEAYAAFIDATAAGLETDTDQNLYNLMVLGEVTGIEGDALADMLVTEEGRASLRDNTAALDAFDIKMQLEGLGALVIQSGANASVLDENPQALQVAHYIYDKEHGEGAWAARVHSEIEDLVGHEMTDEELAARQDLFRISVEHGLKSPEFLEAARQYYAKFPDANTNRETNQRLLQYWQRMEAHNRTIEQISKDPNLSDTEKAEKIADEKLYISLNVEKGLESWLVHWGRDMLRPVNSHETPLRLAETLYDKIAQTDEFLIEAELAFNRVHFDDMGENAWQKHVEAAMAEYENSFNPFAEKPDPQEMLKEWGKGYVEQQVMLSEYDLSVLSKHGLNAAIFETLDQQKPEDDTEMMNIASDFGRAWLKASAIVYDGRNGREAGAWKEYLTSELQDAAKAVTTNEESLAIEDLIKTIGKDGAMSDAYFDAVSALNEKFPNSAAMTAIAALHEELASEGEWAAAWTDGNVMGSIRTTYRSEEFQASVRYLVKLNEFSQYEWWNDLRRDFAVGAADPTQIATFVASAGIGYISGGTAAAPTVAAAQAARAGLVAMLSNTGRALATTAVGGAIEGAGTEAAIAYMGERTDVKLGMLQEVNWDRIGNRTQGGAVMGAAMGGAIFGGGRTARAILDNTSVGRSVKARLGDVKAAVGHSNGRKGDAALPEPEVDTNPPKAPDVTASEAVPVAGVADAAVAPPKTVDTAPAAPEVQPAPSQPTGRVGGGSVFRTGVGSPFQQMTNGRAAAGPVHMAPDGRMSGSSEPVRAPADEGGPGGGGLPPVEHRGAETTQAMGQQQQQARAKAGDDAGAPSPKKPGVKSDEYRDLEARIKSARSEFEADLLKGLEPNVAFASYNSTMNAIKSDMGKVAFTGPADKRLNDLIETNGTFIRGEVTSAGPAPGPAPTPTPTPGPDAAKTAASSTALKAARKEIREAAATLKKELDDIFKPENITATSEADAKAAIDTYYRSTLGTMNEAGGDLVEADSKALRGEVRTRMVKRRDDIDRAEAKITDIRTDSATALAGHQVKLDDAANKHGEKVTELLKAPLTDKTAVEIEKAFASYEAALKRVQADIGRDARLITADRDALEKTISDRLDISPDLRDGSVKAAQDLKARIDGSTAALGDAQTRITAAEADLKVNLDDIFKPANIINVDNSKTAAQKAVNDYYRALIEIRRDTQDEVIDGDKTAFENALTESPARVIGTPGATPTRVDLINLAKGSIDANVSTSGAIRDSFKHEIKTNFVAFKTAVKDVVDDPDIPASDAKAQVQTLFNDFYAGLEAIRTRSNDSDDMTPADKDAISGIIDGRISRRATREASTDAAIDAGRPTSSSNSVSNWTLFSNFRLRPRSHHSAKTTRDFAHNIARSYRSLVDAGLNSRTSAEFESNMIAEAIRTKEVLATLRQRIKNGQAGTNNLNIAASNIEAIRAVNDLTGVMTPLQAEGLLKDLKRTEALIDAMVDLHQRPDGTYDPGASSVIVNQTRFAKDQADSKGRVFARARSKDGDNVTPLTYEDILLAATNREIGPMYRLQFERRIRHASGVYTPIGVERTMPIKHSNFEATGSKILKELLNRSNYQPGADYYEKGFISFLYDNAYAYGMEEAHLLSIFEIAMMRMGQTPGTKYNTGASAQDLVANFNSLIDEYEKIGVDRHAAAGKDPAHFKAHVQRLRREHEIIASNRVNNPKGLRVGTASAHYDGGGFSRRDIRERLAQQLSIWNAYWQYKKNNGLFSFTEDFITYLYKGSESGGHSFLRRRLDGLNYWTGAMLNETETATARNKGINYTNVWHTREELEQGRIRYYGIRTFNAVYRLSLLDLPTRLQRQVPNFEELNLADQGSWVWRRGLQLGTILGVGSIASAAPESDYIPDFLWYHPANAMDFAISTAAYETTGLLANGALSLADWPLGTDFNDYAWGMTAGDFSSLDLSSGARGYDTDNKTDTTPANTDQMEKIRPFLEKLIDERQNANDALFDLSGAEFIDEDDARKRITDKALKALAEIKGLIFTNTTELTAAWANARQEIIKEDRITGVENALVAGLEELGIEEEIAKVLIHEDLIDEKGEVALEDALVAYFLDPAYGYYKPAYDSPGDSYKIPPADIEAALDKILTKQAEYIKAAEARGKRVAAAMEGYAKDRGVKIEELTPAEQTAAKVLADRVDPATNQPLYTEDFLKGDAGKAERADVLKDVQDKIAQNNNQQGAGGNSGSSSDPTSQNAGSSGSFPDIGKPFSEFFNYATDTDNDGVGASWSQFTNSPYISGPFNWVSDSWTGRNGAVGQSSIGWVIAIITGLIATPIFKSMLGASNWPIIGIIIFGGIALFTKKAAHAAMTGEADDGDDTGNVGQGSGEFAAKAQAYGARVQNHAGTNLPQYIEFDVDLDGDGQKDETIKLVDDDKDGKFVAQVGNLATGGQFMSPEVIDGNSLSGNAQFTPGPKSFGIQDGSRTVSFEIIDAAGGQKEAKLTINGRDYTMPLIVDADIDQTREFLEFQN